MPTEDATQYAAVVNHEEQYSIWPLGREIPLGWRDTGTHGTKDDVLAWIQSVWTDMRPLSLRKAMEAQSMEAQSSTAPSLNSADELTTDDLVDRLANGTHPVELASRHLEEALDANYVSIRFPETRGGTSLSVRLDSTASVKSGDPLHLEGNLTLNFEKVRLIADINRATLAGQGRLIRLSSGASPSAQN